MVFLIITKAIISLIIVVFLVGAYYSVQDWGRARDAGKQGQHDNIIAMGILLGCLSLAAILSYVAASI